MNTLVALCALGAEKVLGNEIKLLGYKFASNAPGRVAFTGDDSALFRANLCLRTADRVYLQMASYKACDFDALFDGAYSVNWQDFLRKDSKVVVDKVRIYKSTLESERSIQAMVQKAIYKKLGDAWQITTMPESGEEYDVRVFIADNTVDILLDLSGDPLYKRGYRKESVAAPLRETTAAVMLQMMTWRRKTPLLDPFCGSGTIAIEAALYAYNIPPGTGRKFAIESMPFFDKESAKNIRCQEAENIRTDVSVRISASDIDPNAVKLSEKNAERALSMAGRALQSIGSDARIPRPSFECADFRELYAQYDKGLILCNPPYGERLDDKKHAEALYKDMSFLFSSFPSWQIGVITSCPSFQKSIGKHALAEKTLKAGNLDTRFYMYTDRFNLQNQGGCMNGNNRRA